jgi:hypothetical protein
MNTSLKMLILSLIFTAFCTEICSDLFLMKFSVYSYEFSQSDRVPGNVNDSPICFDSETDDILNWNPKSEAEQTCFYTDPVCVRESFQISTYSFFIWQPPKTA